MDAINDWEDKIDAVIDRSDLDRNPLSQIGGVGVITIVTQFKKDKKKDETIRVVAVSVINYKVKDWDVNVPF